MKDIEEIIQSIPGEDKVLYDRTKIERLYVQFQNRKIDDAKGGGRNQKPDWRQEDSSSGAGTESCRKNTKKSWNLSVGSIPMSSA